MSVSEVPCVLGSLVRLPHSAGRGYQDITLKKAGAIQYMILENYYVHCIAIQHRSKDSKEWVTCLQRTPLMENPWCEHDAQYTHCINITELASATANMDSSTLYHFRIHLYQPCCTWKNFYIKNAKCLLVLLAPPPPFSDLVSSSTSALGPSAIHFSESPSVAVKQVASTAVTVKELLTMSVPTTRAPLVSSVVPPGTEVTML
eukprot:PhF_6_TR25731/c0_g1_i1/m.36266/K16607/NICN1; nicolin-1